MADSKRLTILKRYAALLKTITTANGYLHNLNDLIDSERVFRGRGHFGDDMPVPCVNILQPLNPDRAPDEVGGDESRVQKYAFVLLVQGWVPDDRANPTDPAEQLMADVKKCTARIFDMDDPDYLLDEVIDGGGIEPGTTRPADENSSKAYFWLRVRFEVHEDLGDPYRLD